MFTPVPIPGCGQRQHCQHIGVCKFDLILAIPIALTSITGCLMQEFPT